MFHSRKWLVTPRLLLLAAVSAVVATTAAVPVAGARSSDTRSDVNKHTRAYVKQVRGCVTIANLALSIAGKQSAVNASETVKMAADTCDTIRSRLVGMNTDHFDKQATTAWGGVDRIKSGLNAFVAYIDTRYPSKLVESKGKLTQGGQWARIGIHGINLRRHVYGLGSI
jgi:hypothetical protein